MSNLNRLQPMSKSVDYRGKLLARGTRELDSLVDSLLDGAYPELVAEATVLYKDRTQKMYVESSLLATNDLIVISKFLELEVALLEMYRSLYFDVANFTKLQRMAYLDALKEGPERNMKSWALTQGVRFLEWRFGNDVKISPVEGLTAIFADCYYKSKEAFFNGNSSESSKEAAKWTKQTVEVARLLKSWVTDSDAAMADINIALEEYIGDDIKFPTIDELEI